MKAASHLAIHASRVVSSKCDQRRKTSVAHPPTGGVPLDAQRPGCQTAAARGHSDRSRREGCGTEEESVLGGFRDSDSGRYPSPLVFSGTRGRVKNKKPLIQEVVLET
jgi:hypothetical protein